MGDYLTRTLLSSTYLWILSFLALHYPQQIFHEFGHAMTCLLLGGRVITFHVEITKSWVVCEIPTEPVMATLVKFSGGFAASLALVLIYKYARGLWEEFSTLTLMYIFSNFFTAFLEGFFNDIYVRYLNFWSLLILPFFILAVYVRRRLERPRTLGLPPKPNEVVKQNSR
jgi:hypothetical protein